MTSSTTTTQRFDRLVPNAACRLVDVNEHLLCALCSGYLVDATTIIECLHTFCRSCIIRYLESSETCPVCDVPLHQTNPLLGIRSDTTLQTLVYKLVPGVYKDEVKRRCTVINKAHADGKRPSADAMARLLKDICDMTTGGRIYAGDEAFSVCLQYSASKQSTSSANSFKDLCSIDTGKTSCETTKQDLTDCSYLLCPASLTVAHLKKLIRSKLELGSHLPLELYHSSKDGSLYDGYTLADVAYITAWTSVKPLHFFYCVHARGSSYNPNKANPERNNPDNIQTTPDSKSAIRTEQKRRKYFSPAKGKLSSLTRVKPPPGKCLSTKRLTARNAFPSAKSFSKEKKGVTQQQRSCHSFWTTECATKTVDIACVEEDEEEDSVILLEEDTLDSYPVQTDSCSAGGDVVVVAGDPEVQEVNVKRAFSAIAPDVGTPTNKRVVSECKNSADSALSPNRSDVVTQSTLTSDSSDMTMTTTTSSDVEAFDVIDSASSPLPPKKKKKMMKTSEIIAGAVDRNLFAVINSMIVGTTDSNSNSRNNNDNVVSSSTSSSQVSADDGSDCGASKTSVETQTSVELLSRKTKPNKLRNSKKGAPNHLVKTRNKSAEDATNPETPRGHHPPSATPPADVVTATAVASSAHTSSQQQHISVVSAHTFSSTAAAVTSCTSATLCVPICIGDKGSNLILNLPQNVSVQCRIRSDKILIASNPTAGNPSDTVSAFGSIAGNETAASGAGKEGTALVQTHPTATSTEGTSLLICSPPDAAGPGLVGTGTTVEGTSKERSRAKSIGADLSDDGICGHKLISSNHTEHCQVQSDVTPDKGLSRDQDTNISASISRSASLSCNAGSLGNAMATSSGHSFCSANATRQPNLSSKSVLINSVKSPLEATAKPSTPIPVKTDLQKSVPKQKPVQSVLPNVAKLSTSIAYPPIITPHTVDSPSTSTNKVVLFKPYQMTNTNETKSPKTEVLTGNVGIQPNRQSTCASYRSPQCPAYPSFTRPICTQDEDKQPRLSMDPIASVSADQKGSNPAVHCTAGNVPFRNIIKVPVYTASCSQASRKPEKKSTAGSKFNQSSKDKGNVHHGQEIPKSFDHLKKTSQTAVVTSLCANSVAIEETKESSSEQRPLIKNSLRVDLKLPVTSRSSEAAEGGGGGGGANLADASSQSTCRKAPSLKRQNPEQLDAVSKSPRRRSEKVSVLDEMTYTRAEADSGTSPSAATGSPSPSRSGPSKSDEKKTGSQHQHPHRRSTGDGSPVRRRTLVIDLERCSQGRPPYECISSRKRSSSTVEQQRLQCCSPTTTTPQQQRPGSQARPAARHTPPPTKLVISLPRCQVSPTTTTTTQSPPSSSSAGTESPPPTTKRLKLMCNGMTIYRTLESPGSRSASAGVGGVGSSGTRKSPVSAPIFDCSSSKLSLFSSQKTAPHGKHRPKAVGHGDRPAAAVMVGVLPGSAAVASVDSTSTSPRSVEAAASVAGDAVPAWKGLERSVSLPPDPGSAEEPLELTTKVVKERQKEKDYERFMSSQRPTSAFTA